ncbi:transglutaminase family protein [Paenibacillus sp. CF384]|uniref:transglutaminase-like domain-containing protein n=1 Tax=Paenibacillus sp. CF384 TaxID=1884382 RepID=UPI00089C0492|nr:transglutaminase-like domain-containing protein [Paenibacillus sp. CF384]SDW69908.1 Transglutaminase-like superfamily protein [Paenibacillus sp. CF384]
MSAQQTANSGGGGAQLSKRQRERTGLDFFQMGSRRLVTSLLLFGLIVEWLLPLAQLKEYTELYQVEPLLATVGLFLVVGLFVPPTWLSILLNSVITIGTVLILFQGQYPSVQDALVGLVHAFTNDFGQLLRGKIVLSGEMRTVLLVSGLGMMALALQSLVWLRQWGLGLAALTVVYLLMLYGFLGLQVFPNLMRALAEGLLLGALVTVPRMERLIGFNLFVRARDDRNNQMAGWSLPWWNGSAWLVVLILAIGIGAVWSLARQTPNEPAPWAAEAIDWGQEKLLEHQNGAAGRHDQATTAEEAMAAAGFGDSGMTGYGIDDQVLGSSLTQNHAVLFTVASKEATYLRAESKSDYTGKGWVQNVHDWLTLNVSTYEAEEDARLLVQTITAVHPTAGWPLLAGGAEARITAIRMLDGETAGYRRDAATGALYPIDENDRVVSYTVAAELPELALDELRKLSASVEPVVGGAGDGAEAGTETEASSSSAGSVAGTGTDNRESAKGATSSSSSNTENAATGDAAAKGSASAGARAFVETVALEDTYTQLPKELPARVGELASQIVADAGNPTSRYDQVEAVEAYLRSRYAYSLQSSIPAKGADFVDDFLFRQQQGYCVHFASAMTVMLRTQGIPARYVKGFAPGEPVENKSGGAAGLYTVRASDAHAWVEVFFPGVGWLPFEPTPGFAAPGSGAAGEALLPAGAGNGAQPGAAAGADGAAGAAAGGEAASTAAGALAGRLAAQLQAAAQHAADAAQRGAHALAQAAQGAMAAAPWAMAALAASATGAAGLALAAARRRKSERFAFGSALRRYGSALQAGRHTAARGHFLQLADACWRELYSRCGAKPLHRTTREFAAEALPGLPPETAKLVAEFVRWDEAARYDAHWHNQPTLQQMTVLVAGLQARQT